MKTYNYIISGEYKEGNEVKHFEQEVNCEDNGRATEIVLDRIFIGAQKPIKLLWYHNEMLVH